MNARAREKRKERMNPPDRLSSFAELVITANAACHALRGSFRANQSMKIADALDSAIRRVLEDRDSELSEFAKEIQELSRAIESLKSALLSTQ